MLEAIPSSSCSCTFRQPVALCANCGMLNRTGSHFCRACRAALKSGSQARIQQVWNSANVPSATFGSIPGVFRRPPKYANGFLYGITGEGALMRVSCTQGSQAQMAGKFEAQGTGWNGSALADVSSGERGLRGLVIVALSQEAVEAVVLATGERRLLFKPESGTTLVANASEAESTAFKCVAANSECCAFAVKNAQGDFLLAVRQFSEDKRVSYVLSLQGQALLGPVMSAGRIIVCTDAALAVYDLRTRETTEIPLPRRFKPLFSRSTSELNVPPGSVPLAIGGTGPDCEVWVGGMEAGRVGILQAALETRDSRFRPLSPYSSLTSQAGGGMALATPEGIEGLGFSEPESQPRSLAPAMPVYRTPSHLSWFAEQASEGEHRLMVSAFRTRDRPLSLSFRDARCGPSSCCGVEVTEREVLALYLDASAGRQSHGMRFAHWQLNLNQASPQ